MDTSNSDSLISVDDLIMEIGRLNVEKMNSLKEKTIHLAKIKELQLSIPELKKLEKELTVKTEDVLRSNKLYEENNKKLGDALASERETSKKLSIKVTELTNNIKELKKKPIRKSRTTKK